MHWGVRLEYLKKSIFFKKATFKVSGTSYLEDRKKTIGDSFDHQTAIVNTGKSLSEALIFASTKPQYDGRLFIELQVQLYIKIPSSEHGKDMCLTFRTIYVHNMFSPGLSLEFSCIELVIHWTICRHIVV